MARTAPEPPAATSALPPQTLVVDPGAYTIKAGLVSSNSDAPIPECSVISNCIARARSKATYIGSSLSSCNDFGEMQFKRPVERGYIVNWDLQRAIFEHEFFDTNAKLYCDPAESCFLMAEPSNAPSALQSNADQIIFEEFSFAAASRMNAASLNAFNPLPPSLASTIDSSPPLPTEVLLLVDTGHSNTLITPLLRAQPLHSAVRRINIGGKHISNYLAELISLRHFSLIDEPHIISEIKEDACFVSTDFPSSIERTWKGPRGARRVPDPDIVVDYILPDYTRVRRGTLRPRSSIPSSAPTDTQTQEESFPLANERFTPPELLFNPADIGSTESGIPDAVMQSLSTLPSALTGPLLANVVVVGGTALLPGLMERLQAELRARAPAMLPVRVSAAEDPVCATWKGGAKVAAEETWKEKIMVTRQQYEENGEAWVRREFARRRVVEDWDAHAAATGGADATMTGT